MSTASFVLDDRWTGDQLMLYCVTLTGPNCIYNSIRVCSFKVFKRLNIKYIILNTRYNNNLKYYIFLQLFHTYNANDNLIWI